MRTTISSSDYVYVETRPWREIFQDLVDAGCYISLIAELTGRTQSTVQYWAFEAKELPESGARAILSLHMRYCGHERTQYRLNQKNAHQEAG